MERLNLLIGLSLGLLLTGCPGDDGTEEGGGTTVGDDTTTTNTTPGMTTEGEDTTDGTTMEPSDTTTTGDPDTTTGEPTTTTDEPTTTDDTTTGEPALSFATDVYPIIMANCSCHVEGGSGMLPMPDAATAHGNLVDVPSANMTNNQDRVEPGDPDASFLWHKLNGTQGMGEGQQMPLMAPELDAALLATIEQWILGGAQP